CMSAARRTPSRWLRQWVRPRYSPIGATCLPRTLPPRTLLTSRSSRGKQARLPSLRPCWRPAWTELPATVRTSRATSPVAAHGEPTPAVLAMHFHWLWPCRQRVAVIVWEWQVGALIGRSSFIRRLQMLKKPTLAELVRFQVDK